MPVTDLLDLVTTLLAEASDIALRHFRDAELDIEHKADGSPVTEADKAIEAHLRERLGALFPNDAILGEEHGETEGASGRRWIIDPIDGTKAFSRGVGTFTTLVSLDDQDGPRLGAIAAPALNEVVLAERDRGCWFNGTRCHVSPVDDLAAAVLTTTAFDYWPSETLRRVHESPIEMRTWGDGYGYALVATGRVEAMIDPIINEWDIAPCRVIIPEAGGHFTRLDGTAVPHPTNAMATNANLHDRIVDLVHDGAIA